MGISQREAAEKVGTTARVWQNMEDGRAVRGLPAIIAATALAYGVDRDWLMWGGALEQEKPSPGPGEGIDPQCAIRDSNPEPADKKHSQVIALPTRIDLDELAAAA